MPQKFEIKEIVTLQSCLAVVKTNFGFLLPDELYASIYVKLTDMLNEASK